MKALACSAPGVSGKLGGHMDVAPRGVRPRVLAREGAQQLLTLAVQVACGGAASGVHAPWLVSSPWPALDLRRAAPEPGHVKPRMM
jgi:hypothetical protein